MLSTTRQRDQRSLLISKRFPLPAEKSSITFGSTNASSVTRGLMMSTGEPREFLTASPSSRTSAANMVVTTAMSTRNISCGLFFSRRGGSAAAVRCNLPLTTGCGLLMALLKEGWRKQLPSFSCLCWFSPVLTCRTATASFFLCCQQRIVSGPPKSAAHAIL